MFLCLSSGASARYREDVLRALAMPWGSALQFRYLKRYVAPAVLDGASSIPTQTPDALIAYIDQSEPGKPPQIVPCRFARITEVTGVGTAVTLLLELREFAFASDLVKFNVDLSTKSTGQLPAWQADGKIQGHYWLEVSSDLTETLRSDKLDDWERIVVQLANRSDFKDENCFYAMVGIHEIVSRSAVTVNKGRYELRSGHEYELTLYHFYPKNVPLSARITLSTTSQWLSFTSNPLLYLDSRYDLKRARFKVGKPTSEEQAIVSVMRNVGDAQLAYVDFDISVLVHSVFWRTLGYGVVLGALLAGPQIVATLSNPNLPANNVVLVCLASTFIGLATGIFAAFGLKKSP